MGPSVCVVSQRPGRFAALVRTRRKRSVRSSSRHAGSCSARHHLVGRLLVPRGHPVHTGGNSSTAAVSGRGRRSARRGCRRRCAHRRSRGAHRAAPPCQARRLRKGRTKVWSSPGCWIARNRQSACRLTGAAPQKHPVGSTVKPRPSPTMSASRKAMAHFEVPYLFALRDLPHV